MNAPAEIGHNSGNLTAYEALSIHIADLMEAAQGFLDGDPITTQGQADEIGKLLDMARQARKDADEQRKLEAKPFDDGKKAVQEKWTPLTDEKKGKCALIAETCKKALASYLAEQQRLLDEQARKAREEAEEKERAAQEALRSADATDLAAREKAEALLNEAAKAGRAATSAGKQKAMAVGGARSVSLRSVWTPKLIDPVAALKHYRTAQPGALKAWLLDQARQDVMGGARSIPGFNVVEEKVAV